MRTLLKWHRRIGLAAALLVLFVTVTGLALQYAPALGLNRAMVHNGTLLSFYLPENTTEALVLRTPRACYVWRNGVLYSASAAPLAVDSRPLGAVATEDGTLIAAADGLYIVGADGALLERIDASLLPGRIARIGKTSAGEVALQAEGRSYLADARLSTFTPASAVVRWTAAEPLKPDALPNFVAKAEAVALPWDRILLDLHTGRLFGAAGVWVVNLGSVAFLLLALSGVVTALRRNGKRP